MHLRGLPNHQQVPEEWVCLHASGIGEPKPLLSEGRLSSGEGQTSRGTYEPGAAWESMRELRAPGMDDDTGQQLRPQVPNGTGQGPTGFSQ